MTFVPGESDSYARGSFRIRALLPWGLIHDGFSSLSLLDGRAILAGGMTQDSNSNSSAGVVAPGAKLEKLWDEGSFTEGGALTGDGAILFSDIGDRIMKFDPATGKTRSFASRAGGPTG